MDANEGTRNFISPRDNLADDIAVAEQKLTERMLAIQEMYSRRRVSNIGIPTFQAR